MANRKSASRLQKPDLPALIPCDDLALALMDIRRIEEIQGIHVRPGAGVEIGALTPLSAIEDSEFIRRSYRVLHEAAMTVASRLGSPPAETCSLLGLISSCQFFWIVTLAPIESSGAR